ncbi:MAG: enoyl-CoA hydratase-related protein, partial [Myxococcota bacterium]
MTTDRSAELGLENFRFSIYDDGVALATLDVPDETHNTLSSDLIAELERVLELCETDTGIRALVLASGKPNSFIVGADVRQLDAVTSVADATELSKRSHALMERIEALYLSLDKPVVAAIHGPALGGGLEVALACTLRVCSDSDATTLALPEVQLGLIPGAGGTQRAPKLIGISNALDMILTGKNIRPKKALKWGLVDEICPSPIVVEVACAMALKSANGELLRSKRGVERLAEFASDVTDTEYLQQLALEENPVGQRILFRTARERLLDKTKGNYPAPEAALDAVRIGVQEGREAGFAAEADRFGRLVMSPESTALRSIFFGQTALKKDSGVDSDVEHEPVRHVGVLGGGLMGGGIAYVCAAKAGVPARIKEIDAEGVRRGLRYVRSVLDKGVKRRKHSAFEADRIASRVTGTTEWRGFAQSDIVIEAVFEDLELKRAMVRKVEEHGHERTIFASNTSSIPIK